MSKHRHLGETVGETGVTSGWVTWERRVAVHQSIALVILKSAGSPKEI
jgi:hypothetical protein